MIEFTGGPADGESLQLRRVPQLLRVVIDRDGVVDALDQIYDKPKRDETIFVYQLTEHKGSYHQRGASRASSGFFHFAKYSFYENQPTQGVLSDTERWQTWAVNQDLGTDS